MKRLWTLTLLRSQSGTGTGAAITCKRQVALGADRGSLARPGESSVSSATSHADLLLSALGLGYQVSFPRRTRERTPRVASLDEIGPAPTPLTRSITTIATARLALAE